MDKYAFLEGFREKIRTGAQNRLMEFLGTEKGQRVVSGLLRATEPAEMRKLRKNPHADPYLPTETAAFVSEMANRYTPRTSAILKQVAVRPENYPAMAKFLTYYLRSMLPGGGQQQ